MGSKSLIFVNPQAPTGISKSYPPLPTLPSQQTSTATTLIGDTKKQPLSEAHIASLLQVYKASGTQRWQTIESLRGGECSGPEFYPLWQEMHWPPASPNQVAFHPLNITKTAEDKHTRRLVTAELKSHRKWPGEDSNPDPFKGHRTGESPAGPEKLKRGRIW